MARAHDRTPWPLLSAAVAAAVAYLAVELELLGRLGLPLDDGWIHLQFARNLAQGHGLAYNAGELVAGSTAPLWTALLAILFLLPGNVLVWTKLLGTAFYLMSIAATWRLGLELGMRRGFAALAAVTTLAVSWLVWSALSGMETALVTWLTLEGMVRHLRERRDAAALPLALPLFALAALARPEGLLLLGLAVADRMLIPAARDGRRYEDVARDGGPRAATEGRRYEALVVGLAAAALLIVPLLLFNWAVSGSPWPTTFQAKAGGPARWLPDLRFLHVALGIFFRPLPWATLLFPAGALILAGRLRSPRDRGLLPALWTVALPLAYSLLSPQGRALVGNFGRYLFPLFPVVVCLAVLALDDVAERWTASPRAGGAGAALRPLAIALWLAPAVTTLISGATRYAQNVANVEDSDVAMARWLAPRLEPRALLAVQDIGALKFLLPNEVLDLSGIATPRIVAAARGAVSAADPKGEEGVWRFLEAERPDYLVAFPAAWSARLVARLDPVHRITIRDNVTMAGDELVLYATPWTSYPLRDRPGAATEGRPYEP